MQWGGGDGKSGNSWRGGASMRHVGRGSGASSVMNVGGGISGTRLTEAKEVVLHKACAGGTTQESLEASKEARDCGASTYQRTYYVETKTENDTPRRTSSNEREHSCYEEGGT